MNAPARGRSVLEALLLFALALGVRLSQIRQEAAGDELFHVLAARQWLLDGTLSIHGGLPYERVSSFTLLVAWLFGVLGESLAVARIPALLAGSLVPVLAFAWLRSAGLGAAAVLAGILVAVDPELVRLSQMCRFYAPQHLFFLAGAVGVSVAVDEGRAPAGRLVAAAAAALALHASQEMQIVSRIGVGGLGLFVALACAPAAWRWLRRHRGARLAATAAAGVGVAVLLVGLDRGWHEPYLRLARYVDLWAAHEADDWRFYHHALLDAYPTLWTLFPAALIVALAAAPRPALLSACVFGLAFVVQSGMAFKATRFFSYTLPFFLVIWGIALARTLPVLAGLAEQVARSALTAMRPAGAPPPARGAARAAGLAATALAAAFFVLANHAWLRTARLVAADPSYRDAITAERGPTLSWSRAAAALAPLVAAADAVVVSEDVKALYYLGRADFVINQDHLFEDLPLSGEPREEFSVDPKIDVPLVSRPDSIDRIARCHATGLVVTQTGFLNAAFIVPPETRDHLLARFERVELPEEWGVTALRWTTTAPDPPEACVLRRPWRPGAL